ncbi:unnamed protein product [Danaus chrysippus]|uniref:Uncharacterized protein n=2 Tax=Danaus TaxID=13036 RepID=A0A212FM89_DANPL|nr:hypothetical protein KGM_206811 [Danaus plexippus plexippus]CAG9558850.1 unnamed protein product [Danaus chrysippus]
MIKLTAVVIFIFLTGNVISKIILPHKLRYLENMLNAEVVAKAAKIRQRLEANPGTADSDKSWPLLLAQYHDEDKQSYAHNGFYVRRPPNL